MAVEWRSAMEAMWRFVCPSSARGLEDPAVNPMAEGAPSLAGLGCRRVLVCVAGKNLPRERGRHYYEALRGGGWGRVAEVSESEGQDHVFHLFYPDCNDAAKKMDHLAAFLNAPS